MKAMNIDDFIFINEESLIERGHYSKVYKRTSE